MWYEEMLKALSVYVAQRLELKEEVTVTSLEEELEDIGSCSTCSYTTLTVTITYRVKGIKKPQEFYYTGSLADLLEAIT